MDNIKYFDEGLLNSRFPKYILGLDVGGTNTNIAVSGVRENKPLLLFSSTYQSKNLDSIIPVVNQTLSFAKEKYDIELENACIAAAGVVSPSRDFVKLTNADWKINTKELLEKTYLKFAFIINDFQAVGFGINLLNHNDKNDVFIVRESKDDTTKKPKAIIGAGTGLGKCILNYNQEKNCFIPLPSEGGHSDFPAYDDFESELYEFVKKLRTPPQPLTYEELLSGRGLENIYSFIKSKNQFVETDFTKEIDRSNEKAELISRYRETDETCSETFRLFSKFYGRCAKNFVLDSLATGGLYIAGGIASKNTSIFSTKEFLEEFENAYRRSDVLEDVPIYVITNYDVSLHGACLAAALNSGD